MPVPSYIWILVALSCGFCTGENAGRCVSLCNTTDSDFPQELQICRSSNFTDHCKSLKFHGILGQFVSKNKCIAADTFQRNCSIFKFSTDAQPASKELHVSALSVGWIMAVMAVVGNTGTILSSVVSLFTRFRAMPKVRKLHNILLLNLATADLLMGIYLFTHMTLFSTLGDPNSLNYQVWQTGPWCTVLGVASIVSSQVSVTTLTVITTCRLFSVFWPYKTISIKLVVTCIVLTWCVWTIVACTPLMGHEDTFHNCMYVEEECLVPRFEATYKKWTNMLRQMLDMVNCSSVLPDNRSWKSIKSVLNDMQMFNETQLHTYGYYNELDFCTLNYIALNQNPSVGFLLQIVCFNLLAFSYMAVAYICICRKTSGTAFHCTRVKYGLCCCQRGSLLSNNNRREAENQVMQCRILLLVLTDFACWVPISLIGIIRTVDQDAVSEYATHYILAFLFPLNSALNPFLYSNQWTSPCRKFGRSKKRSRLSKEHVPGIKQNQTKSPGS